MLIHIRDYKGDIIESVDSEKYIKDTQQHISDLKAKLHNRNIQLADLKNKLIKAQDRVLQQQQRKSYNLYFRDIAENATTHRETLAAINNRPELKQALKDGQDIAIGEYYKTEEYQIA